MSSQIDQCSRCGHARMYHIYHEGACRPGFVCQAECEGFVEHFTNMSREELIEIVKSMSWMALDLAQHLNFTNGALRPDLKEAAYQRAEEMAYNITYFTRDMTKHGPNTPGIVTFDGKGAWS